jgi:hypothetical protein
VIFLAVMGIPSSVWEVAGARAAGCLLRRAQWR